MIVRDFNKLQGTDRHVGDAQWTSTRLLLADDKMGFSFHITVLEAGSEHTFHYKHHFESVYCMKGKGSITDLATGETHTIREFAELAGAQLGMELAWEGEGVDEKGIDTKTGKVYKHVQLRSGANFTERWLDITGKVYKPR